MNREEFINKLATTFHVPAHLLEFKEDQMNAAITQDELLRDLTFTLKAAPTYQKYLNVYARQVTATEEVITVTSTGEETRSVAEAGDYIVRNMTGAQEEYTVKKETFEKRYLLETERVDWHIYKPTGEVKAIEVREEVLKYLNRPDTFQIVPAWGGTMVVNKGDFLVCLLDFSEVYRIDRKEFGETYRIKQLWG